MEEYGQATELLKGKRRLLVKTLLLNLAHRGSQILVTVFCFLAGGGSLKLAPRLFAMQSNVVIGLIVLVKYAMLRLRKDHL